MNSTDLANTTGARPRWLWRLVGRLFEEFRPRGTWAENSVGVMRPTPNEACPVFDQTNKVRWWMYQNEYGTHMVKVVDVRNGWSVESNQFHGRIPTSEDLAGLIAFLRSPPNTKSSHGTAQP